jgi:hypothetical protein
MIEVGGKLAVCFRAAGKRSGRSADGMDWSKLPGRFRREVRGSGRDLLFECRQFSGSNQEEADMLSISLRFVWKGRYTWRSICPGKLLG